MNTPKIFISFLILLSFFSTFAQQSKQLLLSNDNKNVFITATAGTLSADSFVVKFEAKWVDKDLKEFNNGMSNVIFEKRKISSNVPEMVKCINFENQSSNYFSFNSKIELIFKINPNWQGEVTLKFLPLYAESPDLAKNPMSRSEFIMHQPKEFILKYNVNR